MINQTNQLFIIAYDRRLSREEATRLREETTSLLRQWNSHGKALESLLKLEENRFLIIESTGLQPGGCSKDSLFRGLREIHTGMNLITADPALFFVETAGEIHALKRSELRTMLRSGELDGSTLLYPTWLSTAGEFIELWKKPIKNFTFLLPEKDLV